MFDLMQQLHRFLRERNIDPEDLTVIFNWRTANGGAQFDAALRDEFRSMTFNPASAATLQLHEFELHGMKAKIESPVHPHAGWKDRDFARS